MEVLGMHVQCSCYVLQLALFLLIHCPASKTLLTSRNGSGIFDIYNSEFRLSW
jgi:hypothetical protein